MPTVALCICYILPLYFPLSLLHNHFSKLDLFIYSLIFQSPKNHNHQLTLLATVAYSSLCAKLLYVFLMTASVCGCELVHVCVCMSLCVFVGVGGLGFHLWCFSSCEALKCMESVLQIRGKERRDNHSKERRGPLTSFRVKQLPLCFSPYLRLFNVSDHHPVLSPCRSTHKFILLPLICHSDVCVSVYVRM